MQAPAEEIDGAIVLYFTVIDRRQRPTGNTRHTVSGELIGTPAGLAICQYPGNAGFYLFYCDADWIVVTDTYHETIQQVMEQAEFEYAGVAQTWQALVGAE